MLDELQAELPDCDVLVVDDGSTDRTAAVAPRHGRGGALVRREPRAPRRASQPDTPTPTSTATSTSGASTPTASTPSTSSHDSSRSSARTRPTSRSDRASRRETATRRTATSRPRAGGSGTSVLRRAMHPALGRPFHDATSGMYAANRVRCPSSRAVYERRARGRVAPPAPRRRSARRRGARPHARARERRVEAAREQGRQARPHGREHAPALRRLATTPEETMTRLVAILGYSDSTTADSTRSRCSARARGVRGHARTTSSSSRDGHAARPRRPRPTSWPRVWTTHSARLVDRRARTTLGNASASRGGADGRCGRGRSRDVALARATGGGPRSCGARRLRDAAPDRRDGRARQRRVTGAPRGRVVDRRPHSGARRRAHQVGSRR